MFKKIMAPIDGSEIAWRALEQAGALGEKFGADLAVVTVVEPYTNNLIPLATTWNSATLYQVNSALESAAQKIMEKAKKKLASYPGKVLYILEAGHPAERILHLARAEECDAIVMGNRGLGGVADLLLGGVSSSIVQHAKIPVLIVR